MGTFRPLSRAEVEYLNHLAEQGVMIPSDGRTGDPDEAHLFGMEYSCLEEAIVAVMLRTRGRT